MGFKYNCEPSLSFLNIKLMCIPISLQSHYFWMILACKVVNWSLITIVWLLCPTDRQFTLFVTLLLIISQCLNSLSVYPSSFFFCFFFYLCKCVYEIALLYSFVICFDFSPPVLRADHLWTCRTVRMAALCHSLSWAWSMSPNLQYGLSCDWFTEIRTLWPSMGLCIAATHFLAWECSFFLE